MDITRDLTLHDAVAQEDVETVERILNSHPDHVENLNDSGQVPLHLVANYSQATEDNIKIIRLLLEKGSNINASDNQGHIPIHDATVSPIEIFALLFEQHYPDQTIKQPDWSFSKQTFSLRDIIQYTFMKGKGETFCWILTKLDQYNKINQDNWLAMFKWFLLLYEPGVLTVTNSTQEDELENHILHYQYEAASPIFLEALFYKIPSKYIYDDLLKEIVYETHSTLEDIIEAEEHNELVSQLGQDTYFIRKASQLIGLLIAYRSKFGLLTDYTWKLTLPKHLLDVRQKIESELRQELKDRIFPVYLNRTIQKSFEKDLHKNPESNNDQYLVATVWLRWNIENKLSAFTGWALLKERTELPSELRIEIIKTVCFEALEETLRDTLPLLPYQSAREIRKRINTLFGSLCIAFDNLMNSLNLLSTQKKTLSEGDHIQKLSRAFPQSFSSENSIEKDVNELVNQQLEILLQSTFTEEPEDEEDAIEVSEDEASSLEESEDDEANLLFEFNTSADSPSNGL